MGGIECLLYVVLEEEEDVAELLLSLLLRHVERATDSVLVD